MVRFTTRDVGCYADGAFGHAHCRQVLADLVEPCDQALSEALRADMSDDAWEEDAALDLLNEGSEEGVFWTFHNGDLVLTALTEEGR
jgi:hypothetical protein